MGCAVSIVALPRGLLHGCATHALTVPSFPFCRMLFYGVGLYAGARFIILNREQNPECVLSPGLDKCFSGGEVVQSIFALITGAAALGECHQRTALPSSCTIIVD